MIKIGDIIRYSFLFAIAASLAACGGEGGYRNIKPTYQVNNAPIPVPYPRVKPGNRKSSSGVASVATGGSVVIRQGDTVYGIAKREGVDMRALISANGLKAPYRLTPGNQLMLPQALFHTVERGDTSYSISRQYGFDLTSLVKTNGLRSPYILTVGQRLKLPGGVAEVNRSSPVPKPNQTTRQAAVRSQPKPQPRFTGESAKLPPRESSRFLWPVEGRLVSRFGPKEGGLHNDGINIRARRGEGVRAAEAGIVAYSGNGIRGFGNLLLVRHSGGWVTAYAHNEELLVSKGDRVTRGQAIAKAGQTGNVDDPQVHFEIRRGKEAVNPVRYLAKSQS